MGTDDVVDLATWRAGPGAFVSLRLGTPLLRLAKGERGAVDACIEAYGPMVQGLARRWSRDPGEVEDLVQEVFVELWRSADRFDPDKASDRGFVAMVARRRMIDRARKEERRPTTVRFAGEAEPASDEHERTLGRVQAGPAVEALSALPSERRGWILMSVVEGYSHREIAARTGIPLGTVKSGIRRGLAEMRRLLEGNELQEVGR